jgi:hypothetical protein
MNQEEIDFWKEVERLTVPVKPLVLEYRLHYNDVGDIVMCTSLDTDHPNSTQYVVVTKEQYDRYFDYIIVDGALKKIDRDPTYNVRLIKSNSGFLVAKNHAGLLLENTETFKDTEYYGYRNN